VPTVVSARFEDLVALALRVLISEDPNLELLASDVPIDEIDATVELYRPSVLLLNYGTLRSPGQVFELHRTFPDTRIVVLANRPTDAECHRMLSLGATACLSKELEARDVVSAIHLAARGMHVLPEGASAHGGDRLRLRGLGRLTPRQTEVLELMQEGATNAEIAERLSIGVETVRTHARKVYRKLGIASRRELARLEREGLVTIGQEA
jgi:NarL family two-component system response regulator LiaR